MKDSLRDLLEGTDITASAPCRVDMGGTLDISTFYYPLRHLSPCTVNLALDLRTRVRLLPHEPGKIAIRSRGFEPAEFSSAALPFSHPLGLICAVAAYFQADGVAIEIHSESPVRSGLGGSSVAATALMAAFSAAMAHLGQSRRLYRRETAIIAHALEESIAGVPCGLQDQLAAAYGGVNLWEWHGRVKEGVFEKRELVRSSPALSRLSGHLLLAYCGRPHESADINGRWVRRFLSGKDRDRWREIIGLTRDFAHALENGNFAGAGKRMIRETRIRREMTPDVLTDTGIELVRLAEEENCGARFTGAGGGGCLWALGETENIARLREIWQDLLSRKGGYPLAPKIDSDGLIPPIL